jgi:mycothiol system anti-sigma-R factor
VSKIRLAGEEAKVMDDQVAHGYRRPHGHAASAAASVPETASVVGECQEALDTLYHFLDGELTEERRHQIQHHLDDCSPCLEAFDFEAELKIVIARRCRETVPEGLRIRIQVALRDASDSFPGPVEGAQVHLNPDQHW